MKVRPIPSATLTAIQALLVAHVPEITPTTLVAALQSFDPERGNDAGKRNTPARMASLEEAADALAVSVCTVRRMVKAGHLEGRKVGKLWRIPAAAIEALAEVREG